jgi:anti-sigma factor ChrR (cupin superfamily)
VNHQPLSFDPQEQAVLYAAGAMTPAEAAAFEARLAAGEREAVAALAALSRVRDRLESAITPIAPPASVRRALMDRLGHDAAPSTRPIPSADPASPLFTLRAGQTPWQETGAPGVRLRTLFVDKAANRMTLLFQLDPGSRYPDHHHAGDEECFVVEGDLHIAGTVLYAGDYHRARADTDHGESFTRGGCMLLVTCASA